MTVDAPAPSVGSRTPAWLLVATVPAFIAYASVAIATLARETESSSSELTPEQLSDLGVSWVVLHVLWMAPSVLAAFGLARLADRFRLGCSRTVRRLAGAVLVLAIAYLVPQLLGLGIASGTWGESPWYVAGLALSLGVGWLGTVPATVLVTRELARRGIATTTTRTIAALAAVYLLWEVVTYVVVAVSSATFTDTVGPPPFLLGLLWAALGIRMMRELPRATHGRATAELKEEQPW